jgi:acetyl esterase/lipase
MRNSGESRAKATMALAGLASLVFALCTIAWAQNRQPSSPSDLRHTAPTTASSEWTEIYAKFGDPTQASPMPGPSDIEGWAKVHDAAEKAHEAVAQTIGQRYAVQIESRNLGGMPVLQITPQRWKDNGKLLVYTHGGAYTLFSAHSTLLSSGMVAAHTGLRVISIDYTNPPKAKWQKVTGQVVAVFRALLKQGYSMQNLAIYGDSAGGGLAAASVLRSRDERLGMPAAVVLWSPWADVTETGDTYQTLKDAEPNFTYELTLGPSADAYADKKDQKNPYVSPVYGDFTKGFPPTLIQCGTREILLSGCIRLYQAIDGAGYPATLDIYEGMPHDFQTKGPGTPESEVALKKMSAFLNRYLQKP